MSVEQNLRKFEQNFDRWPLDDYYNACTQIVVKSAFLQLEWVYCTSVFARSRQYFSGCLTFWTACMSYKSGSLESVTALLSSVSLLPPLKQFVQPISRVPKLFDLMMCQQSGDKGPCRNPPFQGGIYLEKLFLIACCLHPVHCFYFLWLYFDSFT